VKIFQYIEENNLISLFHDDQEDYTIDNGNAAVDMSISAILDDVCELTAIPASPLWCSYNQLDKITWKATKSNHMARGAGLTNILIVFEKYWQSVCICFINKTNIFLYFILFASEITTIIIC